MTDNSEICLNEKIHIAVPNLPPSAIRNQEKTKLTTKVTNEQMINHQISNFNSIGFSTGCDIAGMDSSDAKIYIPPNTIPTIFHQLVIQEVRFKDLLIKSNWVKTRFKIRCWGLMNKMEDMIDSIPADKSKKLRPVQMMWSLRIFR